MKVYYDNYVIDTTEEGDPIYDTTLSHSKLVGRAKAATGCNTVVLSNWYDEWVDDSDPKNPKVRVRARMVMR